MSRSGGVYSCLSPSLGFIPTFPSGCTSRISHQGPDYATSAVVPIDSLIFTESRSQSAGACDFRNMSSDLKAGSMADGSLPVSPNVHASQAFQAMTLQTSRPRKLTSKRHIRVSSLYPRRYPPRSPSISSPPITPTSPGSQPFVLPSFSFQNIDALSSPPSFLSSNYLAKLQESPTFWLALYFCFNLSLTLYNKVVLVRFPFPYTLTALHALFGTIGGSILVRQGIYVPSKLSARENVVLVAFSSLYAINIAVSNLSLQLVTVAFHQVVRAATPIFTVALYALLLGKTSSRAKIVSLTPVILGVCLATYGDYYFTPWGFALTLFGTFLAALKTILTNVLQSFPAITSPANSVKRRFSIAGSTFTTISLPKLHPLDLLHLLSPLAFIQCMLLALLSGELSRVQQYAALQMTSSKALALCLNGCFAFGLNVVSFTANKRVGALGMTVAANVKQVLTILCAVVLFDLTITSMNGIGILLTLLGGAWFAHVDFVEKRSSQGST